MIAEVGAAAALSGLVLVFLGVLVTSYQSLLGTVSREILSRFRTAAWMTLAVFVLGLASVSLGLVWLIAGGGTSLYATSLVLFFVTLAGLLVVAVYSTWRVLLR